MNRQTKIACVGSRNASEDKLKLAIDIGRELVTAGHYVSSGNAQGMDQAFAFGAGQIDPKRVMLYLPWASYEVSNIAPGNMVMRSPISQWEELAAKTHPYFYRSTPPMQNIFKRNVGIVIGSGAVIAYADPNKSNGGGTGHSIRIANALGIPVINLQDIDTVETALKELAEKKVLLGA